MTVFTRPLSETKLADEADRAADILVPVWSQLLTTGLYSEIAILWKIQDTVAEYPGIGLTWEECEGGCGFLVAFFDEPDTSRLALCDSCRDEASHATEEYLHSLVRHRQAEAGSPDLRPTRLADVLSARLKARIDLIEDETLDPGKVRVIDNIGEIVHLSIDEHPNAFGGTLEVLPEVFAVELEEDGTILHEGKKVGQATPEQMEDLRRGDVAGFSIHPSEEGQE